MAHLNVAAKRIEACIAYVGAEAFACDLVETDEMLGDCPVHVRIVTERLDSQFRDADAVVVDEPLLNDVRAILGDRALPVIANAGAETFQRAVGAVMQSITAEPAQNDHASAFPEKRVDGHPLLSALRRVLEATAEQQAQQLARALEQKIDERLKVLERRTDALGTQLASANEELLKSARHACTREDLATATADIRTEIMHAVADKLDDLLVKLDLMRAAEPRVGQTMSRIDGAIRELNEVVKGRAESEAAADLERNERIVTLLNELLEELRRPKKGFFG